MKDIKLPCGTEHLLKGEKKKSLTIKEGGSRVPEVTRRKGSCANPAARQDVVGKGKCSSEPQKERGYLDMISNAKQGF